MDDVPSWKMKPGVYIHIPFCEQHCYYCAFTVTVSPPSSHSPYIRRVIREIELAGWQEPPETIFLGGGTPSLVEAQMIEDVLSALPSGASEVSLEANPGTLLPDRLSHYRDIGITRISLGVQSFHESDLKTAGRLHTVTDVFSDIEALRRHGFSNISLDLIAGLPGQQLDNWRRNLDFVAHLQPEHISVYMLELEERSAWGYRSPEDVGGDDLFIDFYREACERLEAAGYTHYEISNWARPGFECRHNLKYWDGSPYRGFGVGAHSFDTRRRFWNTTSMAEYAAAIDGGQLPVAGGETLTREMRLEEAFLLGLRRMSGFDIWKAGADLALDYPPAWFERVKHLQDAELVSFDGTVLKLTPAGWLVANGVTEDLVWPTLLSISEATP